MSILNSQSIQRFIQSFCPEWPLSIYNVVTFIYRWLLCQVWLCSLYIRRPVYLNSFKITSFLYTRYDVRWGVSFFISKFCTISEYLMCYCYHYFFQFYWKYGLLWSTQFDDALNLYLNFLIIFPELLQHSSSAKIIILYEKKQNCLYWVDKCMISWLYFYRVLTLSVILYRYDCCCIMELYDGQTLNQNITKTHDKQNAL